MAGGPPKEMKSTSQSGSGPNRVPGALPAPHAAVERVEDPREDDVPAGLTEVAVEGLDDGPEAEEEIAEREGARDHDHDPAQAFAGVDDRGGHVHRATPVCADPG